jgi:hypothetical protein
VSRGRRCRTVAICSDFSHHNVLAQIFQTLYRINVRTICPVIRDRRAVKVLDLGTTFGDVASMVNEIAIVDKILTLCIDIASVPGIRLSVDDAFDGCIFGLAC